MDTEVASIGIDLRHVPLAQLHESPLNTRQHFDPVKLSELATSMKSSGQLTPLLARPSKLPKKPGFELAAGHRRRRAAEQAGMSELLVIVKDLDDRTFLEILTIDNLQREDVHPLEEAQGYRNLLTIDGYDVKQIADRVSKDKSYVYDRLTLLKLVPDAQELFFANRFSLGHAILLARVPASVQTELIGDTDGAGGLWRLDHGHATLGLLSPNDEKGKYAGLLPASVRQLQQWIDTHVRFDTADEAVAELFPATAATLAQAEVEKAKVIPITHDYHVQPDAKDEDGGRTYGPTAWKRADGQPVMDRSGSEKPSKTCEYSTIGLIAVGEGRGESFLVCVDKKRCMTHWGDEIRERNKRERSRAAAPTNGNAGTKAKPEEQSWERQQRLSREQTSRAKARWEKGGDAVLRAVVPHVKKLTVGGATPATEYFLEVVEDGLYGIRDRGKEAVKLGIPRGSTATDLMRHLIMVSLLDQAEPGAYIASNEADLQGDLDALKIKIDVAKLLDAANPKKPETNQTDGKPSQKVGTSVAHKPRAKSSKPTTPSNAPAPKQAARKRSPSDFMKPQQPDAVLAAIVGDGPMPRTEIMKKMWNYITKHGLQDKKERRTIIADAKMKAVFGGKAKVSMFEMTKHLNKHLSRAVAP